MTDKKFSLLSFEYGLFEDNETGKGFDMEKCVELLNSMYEENKQLKEENQKLMKAVSESSRMAVDTLLPKDEDTLTLNGNWW